MNRIATTIIHDLAINGPEIANKIVKRTGLAQSTVYDTLYRLRDNGCVESREIHKVGGRLGEKEYSLTVLGLSHALTLTLFKSEEWGPIIERWGHLLPLVLQKWDIFVSAGVEKAAWRNLTLAAGLVSETKFPPFKWGPSPNWSDRDRFYYYFYQMQFGLDDPKDQVKWVKACAKDSDVSDYLARQLTLMVKQHEVWLKAEKAMLQVLQER